ncbi:MAG: FkbM family methyltransferase [Candidatus Pacearchaeota archaeon]
MGYLDVVRQVVRDNGVLKGMSMLSILSTQKFFGYPKTHVYRYHSRKINKIAKMKYSADISSGFALFEIFGFCPYYSSTSGKIRFDIGKDSTVCDIGAFIGDSAVFFGLQGAKVYSYEPQAKAFRLIEENLKINGLKNVALINNPVTFDGRLLSLDSNSDKISDSFNITANSGGSKVKSIKFSDALKMESKWDLVKIDIEGGEWEILQSLCDKPITLNKIKGIAMELHHPRQNRQILDNFVAILRNNKFKVEVEAQNELGMLWAKRYN